jgi:hypothetical protein
MGAAECLLVEIWLPLVPQFENAWVILTWHKQSFPTNYAATLR